MCPKKFSGEETNEIRKQKKNKNIVSVTSFEFQSDADNNKNNMAGHNLQEALRL